MNRLIACVLVGLMAIFLTACGKETPKKSETPTAVETSRESPAEQVQQESAAAAAEQNATDSESRE